MVAGLFFPGGPAFAQAGKAAAAPPVAASQSPYEIAKGDTLYRIAGRTRPAGVTVFQMIVALYRANPDAFLEGNINQLVVGRTLAIPSREAIVALDATHAAQEYRTLIARAAAAVPAPAQPAATAPAGPVPAQKPRPGPAPQPAAAPPLTPTQAAERFQEGLAAERRGDLRAAMDAFLAAGNAGNGQAQKHLGDIYNNGNAIVSHDYGTALLWYQKARAQGVEIPKPSTRTTARPPN